MDTFNIAYSRKSKNNAIPMAEAEIDAVSGGSLSFWANVAAVAEEGWEFAKGFAAGAAAGPG